VSATQHPAASHHLPGFITPPGETDVLMVAVALILIVSVVAFGVLFLRLHSLPERMAHRSHKIQFEIVAVLCLVSLFTHIHLFWIIALLLAMIDIPDFGGSIGRIAGSVEKMAGVKPGEGAAEVPGDRLFSDGAAAATEESHGHATDVETSERAAAREDLPATKRGGRAAKSALAPAESGS
jgi:hypothetical protein